MANIKSAKKRILVDRRNAERNKAIKSKVKTAIKSVDAAIAAGDKDAASKALTTAISEINRAAKVFSTRKQLQERFLVLQLL